MAKSGIEKSSLSLGNIQKHMNVFRFGLNQAASTIVNINKSLFNRKKTNENLIKKDQFNFDKNQSAEKARLAEEQVEAKNINNITKQNKPEDAIKNNPKRGFLGRMMDFVGLLVGGWLVVNWKNILNLGKSFISRIMDVVGILKKFTSDVADFFGSIFGVFHKDLDGIKDASDFSVESSSMQTGLVRMQQGLLNMQDQMNLVDGEYTKASQSISDESDQTTVVEPLKGPLFEETITSDEEATSTQNTLNPLLDLIASAESGDKGYNAIAPNDENPNLSTMTIAEAAKAVGVNGGKGAIGRYQLTKPIEQAKAAGLGPNDIFSPENQDRIALALIRKRGVTMEMIRENPTKAGNLLAKEWAGLPLLSDIDGKKRGESFYKGVGNNQARVTAEKLEAVLRMLANTPPKLGEKLSDSFGTEEFNPMDIFKKKKTNEGDLSKLNLKKQPKIVYVPDVISNKEASNNTILQGSGINIIMGGSSGLNSDDILINELAYT